MPLLLDYKYWGQSILCINTINVDVPSHPNRSCPIVRIEFINLVYKYMILPWSPRLYLQILTAYILILIIFYLEYNMFGTFVVVVTALKYILVFYPYLNESRVVDLTIFSHSIISFLCCVIFPLLVDSLLREIFFTFAHRVWDSRLPYPLNRLRTAGDPSRNPFGWHQKIITLHSNNKI